MIFRKIIKIHEVNKSKMLKRQHFQKVYSIKLKIAIFNDLENNKIKRNFFYLFCQNIKLNKYEIFVVLVTMSLLKKNRDNNNSNNSNNISIISRDIAMSLTSRHTVYVFK